MITASFPDKWKDSHPLTLFDLRQESRHLDSIGLHFRVDEGLSG